MSPDASQFQSAAHPACFEPEEFFTGFLKASGMFVDRFGTVQRRFVADIQCEPHEDGFSLHESFLFDDGLREERVWHISRQADNAFRGTCADVAGHASGTLNGPALQWRYDFYLNIYGKRVKVRFDDLMVQQSSGVVLNRAKVRKFGLLLGELFITFHRADAATDKAA